jgi:hypothetical protein
MELAQEIFAKPEPLFAGHPRFVRVKVALPLIGVSRSKLYALIRDGRVTAIKLDGATLIDLVSVAALFARCPTLMPSKHLREVSPEVLGFEPDPLKGFYLSQSDLSAMGLADSGVAGESVRALGPPGPGASEKPISGHR